MFYNYRVKRKRRFRSYSAGHHHSHHHGQHHGRHRRHHHRSRGRKVLRIAGIVVLVLVLLVAAGVGGVAYLRESGQKRLLAEAVAGGTGQTGSTGESGLVSHNGKKYRYNENLINILCLGIDRYTGEEETGGQEEGKGQADTIFLLTIDKETHAMKVTGISRDTMTEIRTYDHQGNYVGETRNHLGLAYAFGDGAAGSGELMAEAVSNLMYHIPIHRFVAVKLDAIQKLNDSLGGVSVTLPEDMVLGGTSFTQGETVRLQGSQAQAFVQSRDTEKEGSNSLRMERQKQYALSFLSEAKHAIRKDPLLVMDLYKDLTEDMVTNVGLSEAVYLGSLLPGMHFNPDDIRMLQGTVRQGAVYEEFQVDEDAMLDLIFEVFYTEVDPS